jgi:hypothetical protein
MKIAGKRLNRLTLISARFIKGSQSAQRRFVEHCGVFLEHFAPFPGGCGAFLKPWDASPGIEEHPPTVEKCSSTVKECSSSLEEWAKRFCTVPQALRNATQSSGNAPQGLRSIQEP